MTKDEKNRKIAEAFGICHRFTTRYDEQQSDQSDKCTLCGVPKGRHDNGIPDFYTSEEASAMLLERLISMKCRVLIDRGGVTIYAPPPASKRLMEQVILFDARGRLFDLALLRTAICEAFLAMMEEKK